MLALCNLFYFEKQLSLSTGCDTPNRRLLTRGRSSENLGRMKILPLWSTMIRAELMLLLQLSGEAGYDVSDHRSQHGRLKFASLLFARHQRGMTGHRVATYITGLTSLLPINVLNLIYSSPLRGFATIKQKPVAEKV